MTTETALKLAASFMALALIGMFSGALGSILYIAQHSRFPQIQYFAVGVTWIGLCGVLVVGMVAIWRKKK